jgi:hypothetical protein
MKVIKVDSKSNDKTLPVRHLSARVPWHDQKWNGKTCKNVLDNSFCRILPLVDAKKDPTTEPCNEIISDHYQPPCVSERGTFMSDTEFVRRVVHAYKERGNPLFQDFGPCYFQHKPYSFNAIPFKWLMKSPAKPNFNYDHTDRPHRSVKAKEFEVDYKPELEQVIDPKLGWEGNIWVQSAANQKALLDTFFGCLQKDKSLVFFYAKHTPLSELNERIIVGVAKVSADPGPILEYTFPKNYTGHTSYPWDRRIQHSLRPDEGSVGILLPYHDLLKKVDEEKSEIDFSEFVVRAPDRVQFSYAAELVEHDTAIDALLAIAESLRKCSDFLGVSYHTQLDWIDAEISRIWEMRGAFPGLGPVLSAIGIESGNSIAWEIERHILNKDGDLLKQNPWTIFEESLEEPEKYLGKRGMALFTRTVKTKWTNKPANKRNLCKFLSRCQLNNEQAEHLYSSNVNFVDDVLANPYRLYEDNRFHQHAATFKQIDKALFPPESIRHSFPFTEGVAIDDQLDERRVRALCVDVLEEAATNDGHSLLPFDDLLNRLMDKQLDEPFPIDEDVLEAQIDSEFFTGELNQIPKSDENPTHFVKLTRLHSVKSQIRQKFDLTAIASRPFGIDLDWRRLVDEHFQNAPLDNEETEARFEKSEALRTLANHRVSVLIGPAGSGKTELLKILRKLPEIAGGFLHLAPTGKARVKLAADAKTIAQFLFKLKRFDPFTGRFTTTSSLEKYSGARNIIVDECSMITEEQLASLLDALGPTDRLILVGDHRQLPPIGTGRPFFDIADRFRPEESSSPSLGEFTPLTGVGYAELRKIRRQPEAGDTRWDVHLSRCFSEDIKKEDLEVLWELADEKIDSKHIRLEKWYDSDDFREKFQAVLEDELHLSPREVEKAFNRSIGATDKNDKQYFNLGTAEKCLEQWQILSPVNGYGYGVKEINKFVQKQYRSSFVSFALERQKSIARPVGSDNAVYGDKVINLRNSVWQDWQAIEPRDKKSAALNYIANGEIGVITGEFRPRYHNLPGKPDVEITFSTQPDYSYVFRSKDLGDDGRYDIELAYAITVHKAQGSGFKKVFLVLPSKASILSRELIYTALTRQEDKVIILHQGEFRDFARLASTEASATARRFTDLFFLPDVKQIEKKFYDAKYINVSERGERMISKNEVIIANLLNKYSDRLIYSYEDKLKFEQTGRSVKPDFTIDNLASGKRFYWEHLGMMTRKSYRDKWTLKLEGYRNEGFVRHTEVTPTDEKVLIITEENPNGGIDSQQIDGIIREVILAP